MVVLISGECLCGLDAAQPPGRSDTGLQNMRGRKRVHTCNHGVTYTISYSNACTYI